MIETVFLMSRQSLDTYKSIFFFPLFSRMIDIFGINAKNYENDEKNENDCYSRTDRLK